MKALRLPNAATMEQWPWYVRALLGLCMAFLAEGLNYSIQPLRALPLLLSFPAILMSAWFLGMWGCVFCGLGEVFLVAWFSNRIPIRLANGHVIDILRLTVFFAMSMLLSWSVRKLAQQRAQLDSHDWNERLVVAYSERRMAEERARISEALRDRDEKLRIALRANGMGMWEWDLENGTSYRSDEVFQMIGREPGSLGPASEEWLRVIHPEDLEAVHESIQITCQTGADYHMQYRVVLPDGSIRWLESQGKGLRDGEGRLVRVVGVIADITRRKLTEAAMLQAEKLAVAGRLAASVAHEINNPLAAVMNLLFLVTLAETTDEARLHAQSALEELMRVSLITQQTLKFHRQPGAPTSTLLSEIVDAVLTLFRGKLRSAQVTTEVRIKHEVHVACMPNEVQQIFANLISNAIEAMPHGGRLVVRLRPSVDWRDGRTPGMRVTFADTGIGMNRAMMKRIFEPFFTAKKETGTGLGMWVVSQLMERHHGEVRVWSTEREGASGSALSVFLPKRNPDASEPDGTLAMEQTTSILEM